MTAPPAPEYIHLVLVMCSSVLALGTVKSPYLHPVEVLEQLLVGDPLLLVFSVDRSLLGLKATHGSGWGGEQSVTGPFVNISSSSSSLLSYNTD